MTFLQTLLFGTVSGLTILLGLPLARLKHVSVAQRSFLNAFAIGILLFLFVDIVEHALEPIESALRAGNHPSGLLLIVCLGLLAGLLGPMYVGRRPEHGRDAIGAETVAISIAVGIGLHNFSEGLAIGHSAADGSMRFALMLIIGFGLHNVTEAFGIIAPLAGGSPGTGRRCDHLCHRRIICGQPRINFASGAGIRTGVRFYPGAAGGCAAGCDGVVMELLPWRDTLNVVRMHLLLSL